MLLQAQAATPEPLNFVTTAFWFLVGIIISIVLPIVARILREGTPQRKISMFDRIAEAWNRYGGNKYLVMLIAAVALALIVVFILDLKVFTIRDAAIAGIGWESMVNKVLGGNPGGTGARS